MVQGIIRYQKGGFMKVKLFSVTLAVLLSLAFVSCNNGSTDEPPSLTRLTLVTNADAIAHNLRPVTSLRVNEQFAVNFAGSANTYDVTKFEWILKYGGNVISSGETTYSTPFITKGTSGGWWLYNRDYWRASSPGSYSFEFFLVDEKNNKSNTRSVSFTVNQ
jgi:hypothetical protein